MYMDGGQERKKNTEIHATEKSKAGATRTWYDMCEGFCYFLKRSHYNGHIHQFSNPCINSKDEVSSAPSCEECRTSLNMCGDLKIDISFHLTFTAIWPMVACIYTCV